MLLHSVLWKTLSLESNTESFTNKFVSFSSVVVNFKPLHLVLLISKAMFTIEDTVSKFTLIQKSSFFWGIDKNCATLYQSS